MRRPNVNCVSIGLLVLLLAVSAQAGVIIGNPIVPGTAVDTCNGCTFVLLDPFPSGALGFSVTSYSLFAHQTGNQITPLIFTESGGNFTVTGVGTTELITATGAQTYDFGLTDGSSLVGANTYFGYRDGSVATGNQGTITLSYNPPPTATLIRYFGSAGPGASPNIYVGELFNSSGGVTLAGGPEAGGLTYTSTQLPRIYSLQADASDVPEPGTISLVLGGAIMLFIGRRKRV